MAAFGFRPTRVIATVLLGAMIAGATGCASNYYRALQGNLLEAERALAEAQADLLKKDKKIS